MSRRIRLIYFIIAVLVFLVITPLLLVYAAGWRYNFEHQSVEKVGGMIIETEPRGALVTLNDKITTKKTPGTINNLLPGQYTVTLKKDGYYTWTKPITVESGVTNRLTGITLLKEPATVSPLLPGTFSRVAISPEVRYAASFGHDQPLNLLDLPGGQNIYQSLTPYDMTDWQWSPNGTQAVFKTEDGQYFLVSAITTTPVVQNMAALFKMQFSRADWSQEEDDIIYARAADGFYRLNLFQKTATALTTNGDTAFSAGTIFFNELPDRLDITAATGEIRNQIPLLAGFHLRYIGPANNLLMMLDESHQSLYVYNLGNNSFEKLAESVTGVDWDTKTNQVLFFNNLELWAWDLQKNKKNLILRTSDGISQARWLKNNAYIATLYQSGRLKLIEAVSADRNSYELPLSGISTMQVDAGGTSVGLLANQSLYFLQL